jgi:hypothetical protein
MHAHYYGLCYECSAAMACMSEVNEGRREQMEKKTKTMARREFGVRDREKKPDAKCSGPRRFKQRFNN